MVPVLETVELVVPSATVRGLFAGTEKEALLCLPPKCGSGAELSDVEKESELLLEYSYRVFLKALLVFCSLLKKIM